MKPNTNLGTLGRVLVFLREHGIVDIPESEKPLDIALAIILELNEEDLRELLKIMFGEIKSSLSDEEAVLLLENFFTNMGESLNVFVERLTKEFREQKNMVIQKIDAEMTKVMQEIISSTDTEFLLKEALGQS
jgi:hypothetical protein